MTLVPPSNDSSGLVEAEQAIVESRERLVVAVKLIEKNRNILALLAQAHAGPDYFADELRKTIRGIQ